MAYEVKNNTGTLFKNDRRETDSHPHAKGTALIDGVEYWVSAWTKEGAKGKFQSLSFQPKEARQETPKRQEPRTSYDDRDDPRTTRRALDDDLPF